MGTFMRKQSLALSLLLAFAPSAFAASSADLAVTGAITPSACMPSISNDGTVDYGKISMQDLHPTTPTMLPKTVFKLAVNCEGSSLFALASTDNRLPDAINNAFYVLGLIEPRRWVGGYFMGMENVVIDGPAVYPIVSIDNGSTWNYLSPTLSWGSNILTAFGDNASGEKAPAPIKAVSLDMVIEPFIYGRNMIPAGDTIALDGSATFELRYL